MRVSVRIEPEAEAEVEELIAWWRDHRPSARSVKQLLRAALERIAVAANAAPVYAEIDGETVRRVQVKTTPYLVYYYVDSAGGEAVVISVWSGQRGKGPDLG